MKMEKREKRKKKLQVENAPNDPSGSEIKKTGEVSLSSLVLSMHGVTVHNLHLSGFTLLIFRAL